jgi:hypothetical protein
MDGPSNEHIMVHVMSVSSPLTPMYFSLLKFFTVSSTLFALAQTASVTNITLLEEREPNALCGPAGAGCTSVACCSGLFCASGVREYF